jgi:phospholipase A1
MPTTMMMTMPPRISRHPYRLLSLFPVFVLAPMTASGQPVAAGLADCAKVAGATQRLACYDRLAAQPQPAADASPADAAATTATAMAPAAQAPSAAAQAPAVAQAPTPASGGTPVATGGFSMADHWELDSAHKRGVFNFRPHQPNYLMYTRSAHPNSEPYRPFQRLTDLGTDLAHSELAFQLGFKMKLVETALNQPVDLWFGYTQDSFWQAGNHAASSPFRETNYQPEIMAVTPLHFSVLGMNVRYLNLGLVHQSNGQSSTLSRSWNRTYVQLGLERDGFTVVGRVWKRINEAAKDDDNRDIVDYLGRGDLTLTYRHNGSDYSALLRRNFSTGRGAVQLSWAWPVVGHLKGYTQVFSGYGQSLIDYNYYQNVVGIGLLGTF